MNKDNTLAVIIGRFQPLHNGHVALIREALANHDQVLLLVGSVNRETNFNNPLTAEERFDLIHEQFEDETQSLIVRGLKDKPTDDEWVEEVTANVMNIEEDPSKVVLYTSEKDEEFYKTSFIYNLAIKQSGGINATDIRNMWYVLSELTSIPTHVHEFLKGIPEERRLILKNEQLSCLTQLSCAIHTHAFGNPIEPVAHAVVVHRNKILLVKRMGVRGKGQWAIPGGYVEHMETTRMAAIRELKEETGLDLQVLRAKELAAAVEENLDDLSVRTIGHNYLYIIDPMEEQPVVSLDTAECSDYMWVDTLDVLTEKMNLFYNHTVVIQRLFSVLGNAQGRT